jgi:hypothetical protein
MFCFKREFEVRGVDVVLQIFAASILHRIQTEILLRACHGEPMPLAIEIKPVVGDDYPAVLRQMKRTNSNVLFVGSYTGVGATREQFIKTTATADIRVVFESDLSA